MARERIPKPEFLVYAKLMERIKSIILKVAKEPMPKDPEDVGAQAQKIRRVLEVIVNACLAVQMALDDTRRLRRFANVSRADVLKDRIRLGVTRPLVVALQCRDGNGAFADDEIPADRDGDPTGGRAVTCSTECSNTTLGTGESS